MPGHLINLLPTGTRVGNYQILDQLGSGYEGVVYRVVEIPTGISRALKIMYSNTEQSLQHILHTARTFERMGSSGATPRYHHTGHTYLNHRGDSAYYLVFDLLEGITLLEFASSISGEAQARLAEAIRLIYRVAEQIAKVHKLGLAVGDFDSGTNILILHRCGTPVICDFDPGKKNLPNVSFKNDLHELWSLTQLVLRRARVEWRLNLLRGVFDQYLEKRTRKDTMKRVVKDLAFLCDQLSHRHIQKAF